MHDISTREDVTMLIDKFYTQVRSDDIIAKHFEHVDWPQHTPNIINFWCMILLGESGYSGQPLAHHLHLDLTRQDFDRWLFLFNKTVNENSSGSKAQEAIQRAASIAGVFQHRMSIL